MEKCREYLLQDIKALNMTDVYKTYKYVRRYLIANIDGLVDPLCKTAIKARYKRDQKTDELLNIVIDVYERDLSCCDSPLLKEGYKLAKELRGD